MGPTSKYGLRSKKLRLGGGDSVEMVAASNNGNKAESFAVPSKNTKCHLLAPDECRPEQCETHRMQCPLTGGWSCYVVDKERELTWQVLRYCHQEFSSLLTPTEVLSPTDPFYVLCPVNAFAFLLPFLSDQKLYKDLSSKGSTTASNISLTNQDNLIRRITQWKSVQATLRAVGQFSDSEGGQVDLGAFVLDKKKLDSWIAEKTREAYEKLKEDKTAERSDLFCRELALKTIREQLPLELHNAATL